MRRRGYPKGRCAACGNPTTINPKTGQPFSRRQAHLLYLKKRSTKTPKPEPSRQESLNPPTSWWLDCDRDEFRERCRHELPRMLQSRFGQPFTTLQGLEAA